MGPDSLNSILTMQAQPNNQGQMPQLQLEFIKDIHALQSDTQMAQVDIGVEHYLTQKFLEATEEEKVNYSGSIQVLSQTHYLTKEEAKYHEFKQFNESALDRSVKTRQQFDHMITKLAGAIESQDFAIQTAVSELKDCYLQHEAFADNYTSIEEELRAIDEQMLLVGAEADENRIQTLADQMSLKIEQATTMIPSGSLKIDDGIRKILEYVSQDEDCKILLKNIQGIDSSNPSHKREIICREIYKYFKNQLKQTDQARSTIRQSLGAESTAMVSIGAFVGSISSGKNLYAEKMRIVKEDFDSFSQRLVEQSQNAKISLNKLRIQFSRYREKDTSAGSSLTEGYATLAEDYMATHDMLTQVMEKDYCLILGLICKSMLLITREIQKLAKAYIKKYALICDTKEYLIFIKNASRELGPKLETFNAEVLDKMRLYHSRNTKHYLFMDLRETARTDQQQEEHIQLAKVQGRHQRLKDMLSAGNMSIRSCLTLIKAGARRSEYNQKVYQKNMGTITYKMSLAIDRFKGLQEFTRYNFEESGWRKERASMKMIYLKKVALQNTVDKNDPREINMMRGLLLKVQQYREIVDGRVAGLEESGEQGEQCLADYKGYLINFLSELDRVIRRASRILEGMMRNCCKSLVPNSKNEDVQRALNRMRDCEVDIKKQFVDNCKKIPWNNIHEIQVSWKEIVKQYNKILGNEELCGQFREIGNVSKDEYDYFHNVFCSDVTDIIALVTSIYEGFEYISIQNVNEIFEKFEPRYMEFKSKIYPLLKKVSDKQQLHNSREVKRRMLRLVKRESVLAIKLHEQIEVLRMTSLLMLELSHICIELSQEEGTIIRTLAEKGNKMCEECQILSYSKQVQVECLRPHVLSKFGFQ